MFPVADKDFLLLFNQLYYIASFIMTNLSYISASYIVRDIIRHYIIRHSDLVLGSNAEVRDKELEKLQEEIGEGYEVNEIQGRAKLKAEYEKEYSDEIAAARAALAAGDASAAAWHKLKASNINDSLKVLDRLK